jgi:hypothetical protein
MKLFVHRVRLPVLFSPAIRRPSGRSTQAHSSVVRVNIRPFRATSVVAISPWERFSVEPFTGDEAPELGIVRIDVLAAQLVHDHELCRVQLNRRPSFAIRASRELLRREIVAVVPPTPARRRGGRLGGLCVQ